MKYRKEVDNLVKNLEKEEEDYKKTLKNINVNEVDIKKIDKIEYKEYFEKMEDEINDIINSEHSQLPLFIKKEATNLILTHKEIFREVNQDIKKVHSNLVNYINLKKSKIKLKELNAKKDKKKMILI